MDDFDPKRIFRFEKCFEVRALFPLLSSLQHPSISTAERKVAGTDIPLSRHEQSGQGRVAAECGWATVNWVLAYYGKARITYAAMVAVSLKNVARERALLESREHLTNPPEPDGWFTLHDLSSVLRNFLKMRLSHLQRPTAFPPSVIIIGPQTHSHRGHWSVALKQGDGFQIYDTDRPLQSVASFAGLTERFAHNGLFCLESL